jgi:hypothetical protein
LAKQKVKWIQKKEAAEAERLKQEQEEGVVIVDA